MWLADAPTTAASLDLAQFGLPAGNYTMYVKAVGKPSLTNKMSAGVTYSAGGSTPPPPVAVLSVAPLTGTAPLAISANTAGSTAPGGSIASITIDFGDGSAPVSAANSGHTYTIAGTYTVTATVTDSNHASATTTTKVTVNAAGGNLSLTVPPGGSAATIKAGQSASYTLQLAATGGPFSVTVACTGAPAHAACNGPASSLNVTAGSSINVPVTVSTTANASVLSLPVGGSTPPVFWALPAVSMLAVVFLRKTSFAESKRRLVRSAKKALRPAWVLPLLLLAAIAVMTGCGSGKANTPTNPVVNGTPAGTYTLVVTATSGSISRSTQLTLNVQ
jgi:PKD repeat protein